MSNSNNEYEELIQHVRANYASVYLTIVSVIVALALGDLFTQVREIYSSGETISAPVLLWVKVAYAFSAALCVWVGYCHIFITVSWILGIWDALSVMILLVALYLINTTVGLDNSAWWFLTVGFFSVTAGAILVVNMKNAQLESGLGVDALPSPRSWPVIYAFVFGFSSLLSAFLVLSQAIGDKAELLLAVAITIAQFYWAFLWVWTWRRGLGL